MVGFQYNYGTASLLEIVWTAFAVLGTAITYRLVIEAARDLAALRRSPTFQPGGTRDVIAHTNQRNMWSRLVMMTGFVVAGVFAMATPPAKTSGPPTVASVVIGGAFLLAEFLVLTNAVMDRRDRAEVFYQIRTRRVEDLQAKVTSARALLAPTEPPEQGTEQ